MNLPRYEFLSEKYAELFRFTSVGPKGNIKKLIVYSQMAELNIYNLAFGDYDEETESINDSVTTNNNDSQKVLATVASTLYAFTEKHDDVWIYATGSNSARTRLYKIAITINLKNISEDFEIYGLYNDNWQQFKSEINFEAFLVRRK